MAIWVHTHPGIGSIPHPSRHDDVVDSQLAETFRLRSGSDFYGALILSPTESGMLYGTSRCGRRGTAHRPTLECWR